MNIKIEKGIPLPGNVKPKGRKKYPFDQMKVGDSFAIPARISKHFREYVYNINSMYKKKKKFVSRAITEGKETVFRVRRIA